MLNNNQKIIKETNMREKQILGSIVRNGLSLVITTGSLISCNIPKPIILSNFHDAELTSTSVTPLSPSVIIFELEYEFPDGKRFRVDLIDNIKDGYLNDGDYMPEEIFVRKIGSSDEVIYNNSGILSEYLRPLSEVPGGLRQRVV